MNIHEAAALSRLSKRTLHHYDDIGLLRPKRQDENGYRDYTETDLKKLEQILLFREMGFSLEDIKALLKSDTKDQSAMMEKHRTVLLAKRDRLEKILELIGKRIEGEETMDFKAFDMKDIERAKQAYDAEAEARWGQTDAFKESKNRTGRYTEKDWEKITLEAGEIYHGFYTAKDLQADDPKRLELAEAWRQHISTYYYNCTYETLMGLGQMYVADERFTENIDKNGKGTAKAMSDSIQILCEQKINIG